MLLFSLSALSAQQIVKRDSIVHETSLYFKFDVSSKIDSMNSQQMGDLIFWIKENKEARINICGWADKIGADSYNKKLSERRAKTATNYLVDKGVGEERINYTGMGIDYNSATNQKARRSTIRAVLDTEQIIEPTPKRVEPPKEVVEPEPEPVIEPEVVEEAVVEDEGRCSELSLRTNLLYLAATSINLGFEWIPCSTNIGILLNGGYAPFGGDGNKRNLGAAFISPEVRYYFNDERRWFAGVSFLAGAYNYKLSDTGYQGTVYSGGFTGGYRMELSKNFDIDFSLGLGFGQLKYDKYYHNDEGNVLIESDITKNTIMPIQAGVSLIWKIF